MMYRLQKYSTSLLILVVVSLLFYYSLIILRLNKNNNVSRLSLSTFERIGTSSSLMVNRRNLTEAQLSRMSTLGKWLMSPEGTNISKARDKPDNKEYLILVWKYGEFLERRHIKHFTNKIFSPWENCSVKNCRLSYESMDAEKADAILIHLHKTSGVDELPKNINVKKRMEQRWVFLTDESPRNTFLGGKQRLSNYNGLFNWSMTYRMDSDVPVPYGRTVMMKNSKNLDDKFGENLLKSKKKLVAIMGSNCGGSNKRWDYVNEMKIKLGENLDIYGHCLNGDKKICPGHFTKDCEPLKNYKFYLAFENSNCKEYLTEKIFWHAYNKYSVPVIMGASKENCEQLLPPNSYIRIDDFANPNTLSDYLLYLNNSDNEYLKFHQWRTYFKVLNEHGYFQSNSFHYCRLCEALNYNEPSTKIYNDLEKFWSVKNDCW